MRKDIQDIMAFIAVARERSFTRAAARLGTSQSALSHAIRGLEARLGVRLLTRTTRSVAPTEAGERLMQSVAPRLEEIEAEVEALGELREKPAGNLRITTAEHAANTIIWPALERFLPQYPDITVEVAINYELVDIVAERFDIGIRLGEQLARDMIAVPIGPYMRMAVVGSPTYFAQRKKPKTPEDLTRHNCINLRLPTHGGLMPWDFDKDGREIKVRVEGQAIASSGTQVLDAAMRGLGLGWVPEDMAQPHIDSGAVIRVLEKWCTPFPGYHLYYPNRRHGAPALTALVDALRYPRPS
ncbi:LysR family transcriptional regulator [Luteibacter aegosomaticola]|uniref:LysR family transcriptional regulator n=1 Tax=Luteibacter aegosomaticola TaxID=2911538 RepID=UPI001FFA0CC5|nr:LysR family transcriptional regulator [Luteibacter aegosomaticola]UPG89427.1 LysR family transcriptional regulator [Luteibacter aegosomaticola]